MNASYEWLRAFVPTTRSAAELRDLLTMRCATVEELHALRDDLAGFVVGRVVESAPHPDSDHLSVNRVDAGGAELEDVVCGAPNVRAGALYPFAPVGTVMPGGLKIERRKIRGAVSAGMLCSARELGLGQDHEGILELHVDVPPGTPLLSALPIGDTRLVIDVLPNRPDLLSHLGIAREIAAAEGLVVQRPTELAATATAVPVAARLEGEGTTAGVTVRVEDAAAAPRYMGAVVRGVAVGPSPDWLIARLTAVGVRNINVVVDITNYVLHAYGQPMHAFDLGTLGSSVVVRRARAGERLTTLDGHDRALPEGALVIADAHAAVAIAGVMGGASTEVTSTTSDVFLEVACFDPPTVRAARRALGLSTDASYRFERGIDPEIAPVALAQAIALLEQLAGGTLDGTPVDVRTPQPSVQPVVLRAARVRQVVGVSISLDECQGMLESIGFEITGHTSDALMVRAPSWRRDIAAEIDLIEEIARLHGYDVIPDTTQPFRPGTVPDAPLVELSDRLRQLLSGAGLYEARPLPFVADPGEPAVRVLNPIAENEPFLRTRVLDSLARRAEHNLAHMQGDVRLFEIGAAFAPGAPGDRPREETRVAALLLGARRPPHFTDAKPAAFDAWDAKALADLLVREVYPGAATALVPGDAQPVLWQIEVGGEPVGDVRRVALDAPVWASAAFGIEFTIGDEFGRRLRVQIDSRVLASPLPCYPAAEFDLALIVPDAHLAGTVGEAITRGLGELLESATLFDEFRGPGVPDGSRSLAWRIVLRHPERTLRDKEIDGRRARLLKLLAEELNVRPRG